MSSGGNKDLRGQGRGRRAGGVGRKRLDAGRGREPAEWVRTLVRTAASDPAPELWYGQPAYARKGKVVCYFRSGRMDEERYPTFGFSAQACLDNDSGLWPTAFAWTEPSCRWAPG